MSIPPAHEFSVSQSPQPWHGAQTFAPYPPADSLRIADGVLRVCRAQERAVLVPVPVDRPGNPYYYVAVVRRDGDRVVNVVQVRLDFSATGRYVVRARPVQVPDSVRLVFHYITFKSENLPTPDIAALFWDVLRKECLARCNDAVTRLPACVVDIPTVLYYSGRNCFVATVHPGSRQFNFDSHKFLQTLSAVLQEAAARPASPFAQLLPYDAGGVVEARISRRMFVGVVREAGSLDINVVFINGRMEQSKVVFFAGNPPTQVATLPSIPGFNLVSHRLTGENRNALMQEPVLRHCVRPDDRIEPVEGSLASFVQPPCVFEYEQDALNFVRYDVSACWKIRTAIAFVCHSGGPDGLMVPVGDSLALVDEPLSFTAIYRDVRNVWMHHVRVAGEREFVRTSMVIIPQEFKDTVPHMQFLTRSDLNVDRVQPLVLDVIDAVWTRRIDDLLLVQRPDVAATGTLFEYNPTPFASTASLDPTAAARVEMVLRAVCSGPLVTGSSLLIPLPEHGPVMYAAVVRDDAHGPGFTVGLIVRLTTTPAVIRYLGPIQGSSLVLPNLRYLPPGAAPVPLTRAQIRDLFEEPLFAHWQQVAATNPHDLALRSVPLCLGLHPRVGARSPLRVLDRELLDMLIRLSFW